MQANIIYKFLDVSISEMAQVDIINRKTYNSPLDFQKIQFVLCYPLFKLSLIRVLHLKLIILIDNLERKSVFGPRVAPPLRLYSVYSHEFTVSTS